ncbi:F-box family protein, partial [Trifolium medium]|nr:F-box family protein [Trifolium medium]
VVFGWRGRGCVGGRWCGDGARLFTWEEDLRRGLLEALPVVVLPGSEDVWHWSLEDGGMFSVRSVYRFLGSVFSLEPVFSGQELRVFNNIWKIPAPSKVIAFSWKLLRNRIPVKINLAHRGVQVNGGSLDCIHCQGREESVLHLFLFCEFASQIWNAVFRWLGLVIVIPPNISLLFDCMTGAAPNKKVRKGFALIWHARVWMIWRSRNDIIFSNGVKDPGRVIDDIKLLSWRGA